MVIPWFKIGLTVAAVMVVSYLLREVQQSIYRRGWNDAIASVAATDAAGTAAAKKTMNTVDDCWNSGGEWDVPSSSCRR